MDVGLVAGGHIGAMLVVFRVVALGRDRAGQSRTWAEPRAGLGSGTLVGGWSIGVDGVFQNREAGSFDRDRQLEAMRLG